jgi:D-alanyl-lipoteichoic acid acyltransferase DltB (MBOAT superfamily)
MLFNSIEFAIYLPIIFILYWFILNKNLKAQNFLLLFASYFFYGWWDLRFLFLLSFLSLLNYFIGIKIEKNEPHRGRNLWLIIGLVINIGVLGIFKYYNFFIDGFIDLISLAGYDIPKSTTKIIVPMGISFWVFLSLSYIIDIYKKNLKANKNIIEVLLTLSFFPIILAGPIQRPVSLLPQIIKKREFNYDQAVDGLKQILWGIFAKVVIADKIAVYVNSIFTNFSEYSGSTLLLGALFFTIQIYADFSGYSNMAIGIAKLLGFSLMQNFAYPYFSRDITEFWKKWHISLTTWFRDYMFLPISFSISWRIKKERVFLIKTDHVIYLAASIITWLLTGLWHGANYTFIFWGMINGGFLIVYHLQRNPRKRLFKMIGISNKNFIIISIETLITLIIIVTAWVFFRSNSIKEALLFIDGILSDSLFTIPGIMPLREILSISVFFIIEWFGRENQYGIAKLGLKWRRPLRWAAYYALIITIILMSGKEQQFIYFQF